VLPLNGIQIDDTGRKVVFPNIKNKFRFVTVSFLLGSLVTVISSASAAPDGDVDFSFDVTDCSESDTEATMTPTLDSNTLSLEVGESGTVLVRYGFMDGTTTCTGTDPGYTDHLVDGDVITSLVITGGDFSESTDCDGGCGITSADSTVSGTYTVPSVGVGSGTYYGVFSLTWTRE
jgi:hypothetical protein